jgi:L-xylulokinase
MFKSIYEGVAFSHKYHLDKLLASKRSPTQSIRLAGGVARSEVWAQMFADILQIPIEVSDVNETGAFGCAICGAVASGTYASLREAAAGMCGSMRTYLPNPALRERYQAKYAMYRKVIDALDGVWDDMQKL